jgi:hypothetical protein
MGSRQIVLVSTAEISVLNAGIFWREAKTKRLFSQCMYVGNLDYKFKWRVTLILKTTRRHIRGTLTTGALLFEICDQREGKNFSRI